MLLWRKKGKKKRWSMLRRGRKTVVENWRQPERRRYRLKWRLREGVERHSKRVETRQENNCEWKPMI